MSTGTVPIQMCDDEYGCDEWMFDNYAMGASNWREVMPTGWVFDPRSDRAFCPEHKEQA